MHGGDHGSLQGLTSGSGWPTRGMPSITGRLRRTSATASSIWARSSSDRQVVQVSLDPVDQAADAADFLFGGHGLAAGPAVGLEGRHEPLAAAEQIREVTLEVGKVSDVGAEVVTADTAEPDRATLAAGRDVVRLQTDAVGRSHFPDGPPHVFGVQHPLCFAPDTVAAAVELQGQ